jgi:EmrB/QacA subfamily drug resistance transporter
VPVVPGLRHRADAVIGSADGDDPRRWAALSVCLVAGFMTLLDISIVNVALPSIRTALDATPSDLAWIMSGYTLAYGLILIPAGRLGDARGRRLMFLAGLVAFIVASAAAGLSPTASFLAGARVLQGLGAGMLLPQVAGLIQQLFHGYERGVAFGRLGSVIGASTAVGPAAGGLIIVLASSANAWRWVFYVNVPICLVALVLAARLLPRDHGSGPIESLDPMGVTLLGIGLFLLLLPIVESERARGQPWLWALLPIGLAVLTGFVAWERRHRRRGRAPLVDLGLWRQRSYAVGVVLALVYFAGFTSIFFVLTLFLQAGLGYSALLAGLATTPFAVGGAVASSYGGRLVTRYGRALVVVGLAATLVGLVAADIVVDLVDTNIGWALALPLLVAGIGSGLVITPNITVSLSEVPVAGGGSAAGVLQTAQRIGSAVGVAAVTAIFFAGLDGDGWAHALSRGLRLAAAFVGLALVLGLVDLRRPHSRRTQRRQEQLSASSMASRK